MQEVRAATRSASKWCLLVTLDVRNAFNSVSWAKTIEKLRDRRVPVYLVNVISDYLNQRQICSGKYRRDMSAGVPQGSVLGPTLWNVAYDDILRIPLGRGVKIIGYADDIALVISAENIPQLNMACNSAICEIIDWLEDHGLELSPEKTEAVILKGPYKRDDIEIMVAENRIPLSRTAKYLGVVFDTQGYFGPHALEIVKKAERRATALAKILPNVGGPSNSKRKVLWGVVQSTILYAAPVWHQVLRIGRYKNKLESVQRKFLLKVGCAYRTVSASAMQVITGIPPIDLLIEERVKLAEEEESREDPNTARQQTILQWQERWERTVVEAQWTKRLIRRIQPWVECRHRSTNYALTQFLTGHGSYGTYTNRIGKKEDASCIYCPDIEDSPEHTVFHCPRWTRVRQETWGALEGHLTPDNIIIYMEGSKDAWNHISKGIGSIINQKEKEEREHQARPPVPNRQTQEV